jgi:hypothetical protein
VPCFAGVASSSGQCMMTTNSLILPRRSNLRSMIFLCKPKPCKDFRQSKACLRVVFPRCSRVLYVSDRAELA